jgi:3,4-dihydroxy 2-butanone 4-phosphate synthase/GTP cyclohydrolase II
MRRCRPRPRRDRRPAPRRGPRERGRPHHGRRVRRHLSGSDFLQHTSGFLCTAITAERADELELLMTATDTEALGAAFLLSVDAATGAPESARTTAPPPAGRWPTCRPSPTSTGPGTSGRCEPCPAACSVAPGTPRPGVDLVTLAGLASAALLCELITQDRRSMLRGPAAISFAIDQDLPVVTIADLVRYRLSTLLVERIGAVDIPSPGGMFRQHGAGLDSPPQRHGLTGEHRRAFPHQPTTRPVHSSSRCVLAQQLTRRLVPTSRP